MPRIRAVNKIAFREQRQASFQYADSSQTVLFTACPLAGPVPDLTAWAMTRVFTFDGRAYHQLLIGLGVLFTTVVSATALLARLMMIWSRHISGTEKTLNAHDIAELPSLPMTGELEVERIITALNEAGRRLADVHQRAEELARQAATGERLAAIGRIAAGIAHEIRNPIAAIRLKAENALAGDTERKRQALLAMLRQIQRLDLLLHRLLNITERNEPNLKPVAQGSQVRVTAALQGASLIFSVSDQGPGPPPAISEHLFQPFVTGRPDGAGLGLSIMREVAKAHDGTVELLISENGTCFRIIIPWQLS